MTSDVLSDVLAAVRLTGATYFDFELVSPWVAEAPASSEIAALVMPGAQRVVELHLVTRGGCWGGVAGGESLRLGEGDILAFPHGHAHVLASAPGLRATPERAIYARTAAPLPVFLRRGEPDGDATQLVCSFLGCDDRPFNPLLAALPAVLHVPAASQPGPAAALAALVELATREARSARAGSENVLARLSELLFIEAVRSHLERLPPSEVGWFAGLRDALVGRALAALHGAPEAPWTVESLARQVGASRSLLADRFSTLVGQTPMHYLALWRMQLATRRLSDGDSVAAVAGAVGYESEAAFSRAFKKLVGRSPGAFRRERLG